MIDRVTVEEDGIVLDGVPADEIAETYDTPTFVLLERRLEDNAAAFLDAFDGWSSYYAVKANTVPRVLGILREAGLGAEVMTGMELEIARRVGFDPERIVFNGPAKTDDELAEALDLGVRIHVDNEPEVTRLAEVARERDLAPDVAVRIHPDLPEEVEKRAYITKASKLGVDPDLGAKVFREVPDPVAADGVHVHVGTDQTGPYLHEAVGEFVASYVDRLADDGVGISRVNLGGGFAARMDLDAPLKAFADAMRSPLAGVDATRELEPGRVLVGDAVACVATVVRVKKTWGKTWVLLDAGANVLIPLRYTSYRTVSHRPEPTAPVDVAGPFCLPVDVVETSASVAPEPGDRVAVLNAGAYTLSMAESFGQPRPAVAAVRDGRTALVRRRETVDDVLAFDQEVAW